MKKVIKRVFGIALALASLSISAKNFEMEIEVSKVENKLLNLTLSNLEEGVYILVKDSNGVELYKEEVVNLGFSKNYNFRALEDGSYFIEFHSDKKIKKIPFVIKEKQLTIYEKNEKVYYKPVIHYKDEKLMVNKLSLIDDSLEMYLYDEDNHLIYSEYVSGKKNLGKVLNMSGLEKGNYEIILKSNGEEFKKTISRR